MKNAPSFIAAKKARPSIPLVSLFRARWTLTASAPRTASSGDAARVTPSCSACAW